ncbi:hypothetical protein [Desertimonas flava]|uniref:hypothetical protein n=1 Tax=Desertimonas flava TaxID=2064846 RepID=UPI000E34824D|nr:hypothetical protein [Desertimonas flava]
MNDVDLAAAEAFLTTHGRQLDRLRLQLQLGAVDAPQVLSALDGYQNPDGSYGWGLEPDLRDRAGQPGAALHAFEVFDEVAALTGIRTPSAVKLCDWLGGVALADGGLPFALPVVRPDGCAPFWRDADPTVSSLHITAAVTAPALRLARHDEVVAAHPWLVRSTRYCLDQIAARQRSSSTLELTYSLAFLDALAATDETTGHARRLGAVIPADGMMHVEGGRDDEFLRPLNFSPFPGGPSRSLFDPAIIGAELDRLASRQLDDGGWPPEFDSYSPAAELEWRGYLTVAAVITLRANAAPTP